MAAVDGECEVKVAHIHCIDTEVILDVSFAVCAFHDCLHISGTIITVGDISGDFSPVHRSEPCSPVLSRTGAACGVTGSPSVIVGTQYCIFRFTVCTAEYNNEVVPIVSLTAVVGERCNVCLACRYVDVVGVHRPPSTCIVSCSQRSWGYFYCSSFRF